MFIDVCTIILCVLSVEPAKYEGDIKSSLVLKYYPGVDVLYCDNDTRSASTQEGESGVRQPEIIFATLSAHKYHSSSELGKQISDTVL